MGLNVGGIYVKAARPDITQDLVAHEVTRYWVGRGAKEDTRNPLELEPLSLEKTGRLGYAILPSMEGWFGVYDSERYQADQDLAKHLAEALSVETWWYQVAEVTDAAFIRRFGSGGNPLPSTFSEIVALVENRFPAAFLYYNKLTEEVDPESLGTFKLLGFKEISPSPDTYYSGATAEDIAHSEHFFASREAARSGDVSRFLGLLQARPELAEDVARETIGALDLEDAGQRQTLLAIARKSRGLSVFDDTGYLIRFFKAALLENDREILVMVERKVTPANLRLGEELSILGYYTMIDGRFDAARSAFDLALRVNRLPKEAYCNALYVLLPSNSGLPIDKATAHGFLDKCLPAAPRNPAIFRNAACVYAALKEKSKAIAMIQKARDHGYDKMKEMLKDEELESLQDDPRFIELVTGIEKKPAKKKPAKKKPAKKKPAKKKPAKKKPAKKKPAKKKPAKKKPAKKKPAKKKPAKKKPAKKKKTTKKRR